MNLDMFTLLNDLEDLVEDSQTPKSFKNLESQNMTRQSNRKTPWETCLDSWLISCTPATTLVVQPHLAPT